MKTILLVDDDRQLRSMFALALRKKDYHVIEAESGREGLALARQHLPDLILSDINMPGGDGSTLLRDIRADPELRTRQVVLMTGRPDLVTPRRGMEEGADDFLVKPVTIASVLSCVKARFSRVSISWRVEDQILTQLRSGIPSQLPHEFFTPMAGIIGLMEILRSDFPGLAQEEVMDIHNDIYFSALRLNRTLRNYLLLLDLRADSFVAPIEKLEPDQVEESINAGIAEALRLNGSREQDIVVRLGACPVQVKPEDLSRTVEELVDNAAKYSRQGTAIDVELSAEGVLTVTDRGRGLTPEQVGRIEAFQQFDRNKHEQQGLGLGLVLVQKLVAQYQGTLSLISKPGEGTRAQIAFTSHHEGPRS